MPIPEDISSLSVNEDKVDPASSKEAVTPKISGPPAPLVPDGGFEAWATVAGGYGSNLDRRELTLMANRWLILFATFG